MQFCLSLLKTSFHSFVLMNHVNLFYVFFSSIKIIIPENIFSFAVGSYLALSRATFRSNKRSCSSLVRKSSSSSNSSSRNSSSSFDDICFDGQAEQKCAVQINKSEVNKVPYQFIKSSGEEYQVVKRER